MVQEKFCQIHLEGLLDEQLRLGVLFMNYIKVTTIVRMFSTFMYTFTA